jgi:hypothetical protein
VLARNHQGFSRRRVNSNSLCLLCSTSAAYVSSRFTPRRRIMPAFGDGQNGTCSFIAPIIALLLVLIDRLRSRAHRPCDQIATVVYCLEAPNNRIEFHCSSDFGNSTVPSVAFAVPGGGLRFREDATEERGRRWGCHRRARRWISVYGDDIIYESRLGFDVLGGSITDSLEEVGCGR